MIAPCIPVLSPPMQALLKACAAHDRVEPQALLARLIDARAKEIGVFRLASACREADAAQTGAQMQDRDAAGAQRKDRDAAGAQRKDRDATYAEVRAAQKPAAQPYSVRATATPLPQGVVTDVFVDCENGQVASSRFNSLLDAAQIRAEAALMAARCFGAPGGAA